MFFISALTGDGVPELKARLAALMPEGPWHYPEDQVSDASERLLACEITREQLYRQLHDELPYDSAVRPESYTPRKDGSVEIHQQIVIARDSQKGIVLGKGGSKLKAIGEASRKELTELLGVKVHLFLHVKVDEKWSEDKEIYEEMGLDWVRLPQLGDPDPVQFGPLLGRFLAAVERLGDFLEAFALASERSQFGDFVALPRLAVAGEVFAHAFTAFFLGAAFFLAGALRRPPFLAGPFAARSVISVIASSAVRSSGALSRGRVALVVPSVT